MPRGSSWDGQYDLELDLNRDGNSWNVEESWKQSAHHIPIVQPKKRYVSNIGWVVEGREINPIAAILGEGEFIRILMEVNCSGYYSPANLSGHPDTWYPGEGEDEREIESITIEYYDEDEDEVIQEIEIVKEIFPLFEKEFQSEIENLRVESVY